MSTRRAAELLPDLDLSILDPATLERQTVAGPWIGYDFRDIFAGSPQSLREVFTALATKTSVAFETLLDARILVHPECDVIAVETHQPETDPEFSRRVRDAHAVRTRQLAESLRQSVEGDRNYHEIYVLIAKVLSGTATPEERTIVAGRFAR